MCWGARPPNGIKMCQSESLRSQTKGAACPAIKAANPPQKALLVVMTVRLAECHIEE